VFLLFAVVPLVVGIALLAVRGATLAGVEEAKDWIAAPCLVEQAEFETHDGRRSLRLVYRYEIEGAEYRSDRLDLLPGSMGDDDTWERKLFEAHPAGSRAVCYVDPGDPASAVLDREHGVEGANRLRLLAFPFLCVGGGFLLAIAIRVSSGWKAAASRRRDDVEGAPEPPPRRIGVVAALAIIVGGPGGSQTVWLFFVGFSFVFVILGGPTAFADLFPWPGEQQRIEGRITHHFDRIVLGVDVDASTTDEKLKSLPWLFEGFEVFYLRKQSTEREAR
jgi:hypothetical protein